MPPSNMRSNSFDITSLVKPNVMFVVMIFGALIAFEIFNYSTTDLALSDLLGELTFIGIPWATILALAFCGIDFAGIARLFTPEQGADEPKEVWYLFAAWLLAATMNAILTWWGVSMAVANHSVKSSAIIDPETLTKVVPVFVAIMVWVIRILIIGTLSLAMDRLLHTGLEQRPMLQNSASASSRAYRQPLQSAQPMSIPANLTNTGLPARPSLSRSASANSRNNRSMVSEESAEYIPEAQGRARPEPTYHSLSMSARPQVNGSTRTNDGGTGQYRR